MWACGGAYFGQQVENDAVVIFRKENFDQNIRSQVFLNAPPGLIYPGDEGFRTGRRVEHAVGNLAPRAGLAWDVHGDGRLAVRTSCSMGYDFMAGEHHNINAGPRRSATARSSPIRRAAWTTRGGTSVAIPPHRHRPQRELHPFGAFGSMDPDINSPRAQQWNVTLERQLGASWGVSASYLGSYADRLWAQTALNPGVFLGLGPCTLNTADGPRSYPVCTTNANLNERRSLSLENPGEVGQYRRARPQLGRRLAEVSWPEAGSAASDHERRQPQRHLHAVAVQGHADHQRLQSDERRLHESGRPGSRRRLLRSRPHAPGDAQHGLPDAGGR